MAITLGASKHTIPAGSLAVRLLFVARSSVHPFWHCGVYDGFDRSKSRHYLAPKTGEGGVVEPTGREPVSWLVKLGKRKNTLPRGARILFMNRLYLSSRSSVRLFVCPSVRPPLLCHCQLVLVRN